MAIVTKIKPFTSKRAPCLDKRKVEGFTRDRKAQRKSCITCSNPIQSPAILSKRDILSSVLVSTAFVSTFDSRQAVADDFIRTESGLKILDIRTGEGAYPEIGDTVSVHWSGFTKGYQGKRIDNTSIRDEPYEFVLGSHQAIPAFEEAVSTMRAGGIRRIEVPGDHPELSYSINRGERFTDELISADMKIFKYRYGPQPAELGGQRALDFVLDNATLRDFNRTLLFDIKLLAVRKNKK